MAAALLLLTGCGADESARTRDLALEVREAYLTAQTITAQGTITADYGQRVYDLGVDLAWDQEEGLTLTVTEPELLQGITARVRAGETTLEYQGVSLGTGYLTQEGLSPLGAMPYLLEEITQGYMAQCTVEKLGESDCLRVEFCQPEDQSGEGTSCTLWFDPDSRALVRGEIFSQGTLVLTAIFSAFTLA